MENKDNSERIERFLREQMTPDENELFLKDLRCDKELREEAQMMALLIKEMKEEQAQRDAEIIDEVLASKKKDKIIQMVRYALSLAAMFVLIFGGITLWNKQSDTDALFAQYYTTYDSTLARGGDDEAIRKELAELYNKVGTETNVTPIITRLQTIFDGIQANNDKYADYSYYENDIAWYLTLAYIKDHNVEKAKELLKPLAQKGDMKAKTLLEELE